MTAAPVNVSAALASFDAIYSPRIVARMNDYEVRVAHTKGELDCDEAVFRAVPSGLKASRCLKFAARNRMGGAFGWAVRFQPGQEST